METLRLKTILSLSLATALGACDVPQSPTASTGGDAANASPTPVPSLHSASIPIANAVVSDPNALGWNAAGSELSLKGATVGAIDCSVSGSTNLSGSLGITSDGFGGLPYKLSTSKTISSNVMLDRLQTNINRNGATGSVVFEVRVDESGAPGALVATSEPITVSTMVSWSSSAVHVFKFPSPPLLSAGTTYHFVFTGGADFVSTGGNKVLLAWMGMNVCSMGTPKGFDGTNWISKTSLMGGSWVSWVLNLYGGNVSADGPTAALNYDTGGSGTVDLSSFVPVENPLGETGAITYDAGASNDSATPVYSLNGLTAEQIRGSGTLAGRYFFLRMHFLSDGLKGAGVGNIAIRYSN